MEEVGWVGMGPSPGIQEWELLNGNLETLDMTNLEPTPSPPELELLMENFKASDQTRIPPRIYDVIGHL